MRNTIIVSIYVLLFVIIFSCNGSYTNNNCNPPISSGDFYTSKVDSFKIYSINYCQRGFVCVSTKEDSCIKFAAVYDERLGADFYSLAEVGDIVIKESNSFTIVLLKDNEEVYNIFVGWDG